MVAAGLLLAALILIGAGPGMFSTGAFCYTAGVSCYSTALVYYVARSGRVGVAALVYAVAGWAGSALGIGMAGYHFFENMGWVDAFENAAMILSGMGPVSALQSDAGKIFAGCYALFSGLLLITVTGIVLAPVIHRGLHKFHLESGKKNS